MQPIVANIVVIGLLVFLFGVVFLARPDDRFRCWISAWVCILIHFATELWSPSSAFWANLLAVVSVDMLALAGIFLVVSTIVLTYGRQQGLMLGSLLAVTTLPCIALAIVVPDHIRLLLAAVVARQALAVVMAAWKRSQRPLFAGFAVSACLVSGAWMVYGLLHGQPEIVYIALLSEIYFVTAVNFWSYNWRRTLALNTVVVGLVAWAAVFPTGLLVQRAWPHFAVNAVIWNIPKFCVALGMILLVMEEDSRAVRGLADGYRLLFDANPHPLWVIETASQRVLSANQAALDIHGYTRDEFLRLKITDLLHPETVPGVLHQLDHTAPRTIRASRHIRKDGSVLPMDINAHSIEFQGKPCRFVLGIDVTEREELQLRLVHQARRDALTGLPNRLLFQELLPAAVADSIALNEKLAVLSLDIDRFKRINDTYGVDVGDECLKHVATRLGIRTRTTDVVARTAGDEFSIVLTGLKSAASVEQEVCELRETLAQPLLVRGYQIQLAFSIGLSIYPDDGSDAMVLWRGAESAKRQAEADGGDRTVWLSPELNRAAEEQIELEDFMRLQLEQDGFNLEYQPFYDADGSIRVLEALLRLHHPRHGAISPGRFIPIAEETGLIVHLGQWVLEEVCRQLLAWKAAGNPLLPVAVNVSGLQLMHAGFAEQVMRSLDRYRIDPSLIHLEVTESTAMHDEAGVLEQMATLSAHGIQFSIDDFGTGHSSLGRLQVLPLSELKIDRSFVEKLCVDGGTFSIVQAIISMAHALGHRVVAEGVETENQLACLLQLKCDLFQGFLFSRPVHPSLISGLMSVRHPAFQSLGAAACRCRPPLAALEPFSAGQSAILLEGNVA